MPWPLVILGWPGALAALALLGLGALTRHHWLAGAGAVLSTGFCFYIALHPMPFRALAAGALAANLLAAMATRLGARRWALALLLPYLGLLAYVGYLVLGARGPAGLEPLRPGHHAAIPAAIAALWRGDSDAPCSSAGPAV